MERKTNQATKPTEKRSREPRRDGVGTPQKFYGTPYNLVYTKLNINNLQNFTNTDPHPLIYRNTPRHQNKAKRKKYFAKNLEKSGQPPKTKLALLD